MTWKNGCTVECCNRAYHDSGSSLYHGRDIGLVTAHVCSLVLFKPQLNSRLGLLMYLSMEDLMLLLKFMIIPFVAVTLLASVYSRNRE